MTRIPTDPVESLRELWKAKLISLSMGRPLSSGFYLEVRGTTPETAAVGISAMDALLRSMLERDGTKFERLQVDILATQFVFPPAANSGLLAAVFAILRNEVSTSPEWYAWTIKMDSAAAHRRPPRLA